MFSNQQFPMISCLLVTAKGRFHLAKRSIDFYVAQTYENRELVIVNEGPRAYQLRIEEYVKTLNRPDIRFVWLNGSYTLGALRNISMAVAQGELFVQWDDDDFCMPQRIATQYAFLARHPEAKVCYLSDQLHYFFQDNTLYWDNWKKYHSGGGAKRYSLIPGTIMAYKNVGVRYPSSGIYCRAGEDSILAERLLMKESESVILLEGAGYMHMYTHHGCNQVYNIDHHSNISQSRGNNRDFIIKHRPIIIESINYFKLDGVVQVMSSEGLVFTYTREDC